MELWINYVDGRHEEFESHCECESDLKYPEKTRIDEADDTGYDNIYSDDDQLEHPFDKSPHAYCQQCDCCVRCGCCECGDCEDPNYSDKICAMRKANGTHNYENGNAGCWCMDDKSSDDDHED